MELDKTISIQEILANDIIRKLEYLNCFEFVVIAGGAPRNWLNNKPANDLDFYVKLKPEFNTKKESLGFLLQVILKTEFIELKKEQGYEEFIVFNGTIDGNEIDICVDKSGTLKLEDILVSFDANMSEVAYSKGIFKVTKAFMKGMSNKTIKYTGQSKFGYKQKEYLEKV